MNWWELVGEGVDNSSKELLGTLKTTDNKLVVAEVAENIAESNLSTAQLAKMRLHARGGIVFSVDQGIFKTPVNPMIIFQQGSIWPLFGGI